VLGGTKREEEVLGQTLATMLGTAVLIKRPAEERMLVLGVGLQGLRGGSEVFEEMVGLCLRVL
jgi:proteasome assembly chaperone 3